MDAGDVLFEFCGGVGNFFGMSPNDTGPCGVLGVTADDVNVQLWHLIADGGDIDFFHAGPSAHPVGKTLDGLACGSIDLCGKVVQFAGIRPLGDEQDPRERPVIFKQDAAVVHAAEVGRAACESIVKSKRMHGCKSKGEEARKQSCGIVDCRTRKIGYAAGVSLWDPSFGKEFLPITQSYLVGVSGGLDSVALLRGMWEMGHRDLIVCHVDHQLRGEDSAADAVWVEKLCQTWGIRCCIGRFDVAREAEQRRASIETTAREIRYEFFAQMAREHQCSRLVLAHHGDDQAETVLWRMMRGAHGSKGMRCVQSMLIAGHTLQVLRPLLGQRKEPLRAYLRDLGQDWREDASNAEPFAIRNRLRHELLPLMNQIAARDVTPCLMRQALAWQDMEEVQQWALEQARVLDPRGRLHVPTVRALPVAMQMLVLHDYLQRQQIPEMSRDLLERCVALLQPEAAAVVNLPGGKFLRRRQARLWIEG